MNLKHMYRTATFLLLGMSIAGHGFAQDATKLFDQSTIGYARIDLQTVDLPALQKRANEFVAMLDDGGRMKMTSDGFFQGIAPLADTLTSQGVTEVFAVLSLNDVPATGPHFFFACPNGQRVSVQKFVGNFNTGMSTSLIEGGVVMGSPEIAKRLTNNRSLRADMAEIFKLHQAAPISVVFCPSSDQRKAMSELMVDLPEPFDGITGKQIAQGASLTTLRMDPKADSVIELVCKGNNAEQNQLFAKSVKRFIDRLAGGTIQVPRPDVAAMFKSLGIALQTADLSPLDQPSDGQFTITFKQSDGSYEKMLASLKAPVNAAQAAASLTRNSNNMRVLLLACHNYHDARKAFPGLAITDDQGKALLSWRVAILPYLDENELYEKFKLDEPWDSPHNQKLIPLMPSAFTSRTPDKDNLFATRFMLVTGPECIGQAEGMRLQDITDGSSRTIMFVEVRQDKAVPWTQPTDWTFDTNDPLKGIVDDGQEILTFGFADGSIQRMRTDEADTIRTHMTYKGGDHPNGK